MLLWDSLTKNKDTGRVRSRVRNCGLLTVVLALLATAGVQAAEAGGPFIRRPFQHEPAL